MKKLHASQQTVLTFLRDNTEHQDTTATIAAHTGLTVNITKHACTALFKQGLILRTKDKPTKWYAAPQVVEQPPQPSPGSIHGSMPQA